MSHSNITVKPCNDREKWSHFLANSPQGTRYAEPCVIESLGCKADYWFVYKNTQLCAGFVSITHNPIHDGLPMHSYYIGMMYHREIWQAKQNRRTENELLIAESAMQRLSEHYDHLNFELHPSITDIRGYDWFNYHKPEYGRANIDVRYSAVADLSSAHQVRSAARGSRRREEKYAHSRENLTFSVDNIPDILVDLYEQSLSRQDIPVSTREKDFTYRFASELLDKQWGAIGIVEDSNKIPQAAGLLLFDHNGTCHLPVVGTGTSQYGGTMLYFGLMDYAAEQGFRKMDFNGANSPSRGYFKHSIGGAAQPYFCISWSKPDAPR